MNERYALCRGFSLIELTVVLLLITLIASVAVRETSELAFQARYEQTKERLEMIKQAILGNPRQIVNGQQAISGFVADMGRLPGTPRELLQPAACLTATSVLPDTFFECVDAGETWTWFNTPCTDGVSADKATCEAVPAIWLGWRIDERAQMGMGWRGPYLSVSSSPNSVDAFTDAWGTTTADDPATTTFDESTAYYGWRFTPGLNPAFLDDGNAANDQNDVSPYPRRLVVQSLGKDQLLNGLPTNDFIDDYPDNVTANDAGVYFPNPLIETGEWLADVRGGVSVTFRAVKNFFPNSFCSDPSKTSAVACLAPDIWYGGCTLAGFYNKSSCLEATPTPGEWRSCSDAFAPPIANPLSSTGSTNKSTCGSNYWYGEGLGCSDTSKTTKADCTSPAVWRSCSDDGTITNQASCLPANNNWYGQDLAKISLNALPSNTTSTTIPLCIKIFYRKPDLTIGSLVGDENTADADNDPKPILADDSIQTIRFTEFRDKDTGNVTTELPAGSNAIAIYQYDGSDCSTSNIMYPINRQKPVQVDFRPHASLPVINW